MDPVATPRLPVYGPADAQADVTAAPGRRGPSAPRQPTSQPMIAAVEAPGEPLTSRNFI